MIMGTPLGQRFLSGSKSSFSCEVVGVCVDDGEAMTHR